MSTDSPNVIAAFTEEQAASLTGLTVHRLRHWDRTKFFEPEFGSGEARSPYSRVYSFSDLLSLQILKALRIDMGCSLQHLREVKNKLAHLGEDKWSRTTLSVLKKKVVFRDTELDEQREVVSGQIVFAIPLGEVRANMKAAVAALKRRNDSELGRVAQRRNVNHNVKVIAGTRIPVAAIRRLSEDGYSVAQILKEYPSLAATDVKAALQERTEKTAA